ncbi:hypothetical protein ACFLS7_02190 [Bacteroidota bacterium]
MRRVALFFSIPVLIFIATGCTKQPSSSFLPGFNKQELTRLLPVVERVYDSVDIGGFKTPEPVGYQRTFRSSVSPLMNRFDFWLSHDNKGIINIRGTILDTAGLSFALDFYALMVPAIGEIQLSDSTLFKYKVAELPGAAVHLGFLMGLGLMSNEMLEQINQHYQKGVRDFYILGHSQGSGIAYLTTAYLSYLQKDGSLPTDIRFKSYCVAAPKAGNLLFAYDYENLTQGGWAYSIQNITDWVPGVPMTIQGATDAPPVNPFNNIQKFLTEIHFPPGPNFEQGFDKFSKILPEVNANLLTLIHNIIFPRIIGAMPGFTEPASIPSFDFERMGITIPLIPDSSYYSQFPRKPTTFNVWENHSVYPYYILVSTMN